MAEQTFGSPGFFDREIDLSAPAGSGPDGSTPAGFIGTSNRGAAFVPVTLGTFNDFKQIFGDLDPKKFGPYAVNQFLNFRGAATYLRVLGAGANATVTDIENTNEKGQVVSAGFKVLGTVASGDAFGRHVGSVQFIVANHLLAASEAVALPMFTENQSFSGMNVNVVRGMVMMASGTRMLVYDGNASISAIAGNKIDSATVVSGKFKMILSSTLQTFGHDDGMSGVRVMTASLDPSSTDYFAKVLNTDPDQFASAQHLLYADFAVDNEIAAAQIVGVVSGSKLTSTDSGDTSLIFRDAFGSLNTRYATPSSPWFISQPFGQNEHNLFKFEALDDGEYANKLYKISIVALKASLDESAPFGTFSVQIRDWNDTDLNPVVLETFSNCSLDPTSPRFIASVIGDKKTMFNFDATVSTERRLITRGKYNNQSNYVRVIVSDSLERGLLPPKALPFGFRGFEVLKTNDLLADATSAVSRLAGAFSTVGATAALSGSILPPIPFRFKVTKGEIPSSPAFNGSPGPNELAVPALYWGVKFERNTTPLNSNISSDKNALLESYTKLLGIRKLDTLVTGSGADTFNNNKFTLAKVALSNTSFSQLTSSVSAHMREAAYIRNANVDATDYTITDMVGRRLTLAALLAVSGSTEFNRFSQFAKFTTFLGGGFDGVNILDLNSRRLNDRASSFDNGGCAASGYLPTGLATNPAGSGQANNAVASYMTAVDIMTDPMLVTHNLLTIPGIRESFITDYAARKTSDYGMAMYVMDIPSYDDDGDRLFDDSIQRPDVTETANVFDSRAVENNYVATYFPDVVIDDTSNNRRVHVPSSVAAMGALAFNDKIAYPWFAPAGFNRGALDFVKNVAVRLDIQDRNRLYDARINPIATFPRTGWVIFGQKTLQIKKSALDRVNVRRLLLEVKRIIVGIAKGLVFEQNTASLRNGFVASAMLQLGTIQTQSGVEAFQVVMNETNNTPDDIDQNKLNGRVVIVPTRAIEFIALDFVVTRSGIQFV